MDIDTILERAETTETEEHMGKGEELLSQFKVGQSIRLRWYSKEETSDTWHWKGYRILIKHLNYQSSMTR